MFWTRRPVQENEQYRLISAVVQARKQMLAISRRKLYFLDGSTARIPVILAELRFRFLFRQARERNWANVWNLD